ncbi:hypothetical protein R6Q59_016741 [Mikania micrantha]
MVPKLLQWHMKEFGDDSNLQALSCWPFSLDRSPPPQPRPSPMPPHSFSTITTGRKSQDPPSLLLQRPEPPSPPSLSNSTKQQRSLKTLISFTQLYEKFHESVMVLDALLWQHAEKQGCVLVRQLNVSFTMIQETSYALGVGCWVAGELKRSNYAANPLINPTSIKISTAFTEVESRVLEPSKLRFGYCGDWFPRCVRWNFNKLDKYQEQGQLLEPYLESIISPLMLIVRSKTIELGTDSNKLVKIIKPLCIIIYTLVTVCGYKAVIRFFPHHVSDLEPAVCLLEKCHGTTVGTALRQESTGEMDTKCVILLWLSILVLVTFDISSVDTSIVNTQSIDANEPPPLVARILKISKEYLSSAGPMQTIAGLLLSKLLTRPDMRPAFTRILSFDLFFISHSSKPISGKKSVAKKKRTL